MTTQAFPHILLKPATRALWQRSRIKGHALAAMVCFLSLAIAHAAPVKLRTNQRTNPLGVDSPRPLFSWQSDASQPGWMQTAYQVMVASSAAALQAGHADVWDSGRQASSESVNIAYAGPQLKSRQRYFWAVKTWGAQGDVSVSAETATWEMGLLSPSDWQAKWIRADDAAEAARLKQIQWISDPHPYTSPSATGSETEFRLRLHLDAKPYAASLHVLTSQSFTAQVNGVVTGHHRDWASFDREDVRGALHYGSGPAGDNVIVIQMRGPGQAATEKPAQLVLAAALHLADAHGAGRWLFSDGQWQSRETKPVPAADWSKVQELGSIADEKLDSEIMPSAAGQTPRMDFGASLLRKDFVLEKKLALARLYITALGSYDASLNGTRVGDTKLTPGFTDYRKRVLYQTYDVTSSLKQGRNTLGVVLGPGWYGSPLLWGGVRVFHGHDRLLAQLDLKFADGTEQSVLSDPTWTTAPSPIVSSEIYAGEADDARLAQSGWDLPSFLKAAQWKAVVEDDPPANLALTAQPDMPVHASQTLHPVSVALLKGAPHNTAIFDMGQNMVGVVKLRVAAPRGTTVRLRYAERLTPDGAIYTENLRNANATDEYTTAGTGHEEWTPSFTFHGFRYVEVSGLPVPPTNDAIQGIVLNSLPDSPSFRLDTSSDLLNRMFQLGLWGQRGNFLSIPTDCPQRDERMGWMGDAGVFWRTGSYNYGIDPFSNKFIEDIVDAQKPTGAFSDISPDILSTDAQYKDFPGAPGWGDAGILVPYATWSQFGDSSVVERNWPAMERWMDFVLKANPGFVRDQGLGHDYGDWLAPDPHTPKDLAATAYWALTARQMQTMATALGRTADAQKYAYLFGHIRDAYRKRYIHADGSVAGNTQTAYVLTLYAQLAPKELESKMVDRLVKDIEAHQTHLTTGFLGTPFLLSVLDEGGRSDVAYKLLLNTTYPSWGYMAEKGATTWWERWNGDTGDPSMNSYNHYAFGSVMAWVYRRVAGIDVDPDMPGFHHIVIAPQFGGGLTHVHAEYDSVYGTIKTDWTKSSDGAVVLNISIPANTTGTVYMPTVPGYRLAQDQGVSEFHTSQGRFQSEITSGTHTFQLLKDH